MKTIKNTLSALRFDSSVKEVPFFKEALKDLLLSMVYVDFKATFSDADVGKPAA